MFVVRLLLNAASSDGRRGGGRSLNKLSVSLRVWMSVAAFPRVDTTALLCFFFFCLSSWVQRRAAIAVTVKPRTLANIYLAPSSLGCSPLPLTTFFPCAHSLWCLGVWCSAAEGGCETRLLAPSSCLLYPARAPFWSREKWSSPSSPPAASVRTCPTLCVPVRSGIFVNLGGGGWYVM